MNKLAFIQILLLAVLISGHRDGIRFKRQYGLGEMNTYGGGYMGGGVLTPEQIIANRELAISQQRTRQALIASEIASNQAVREARVLNAETRLEAEEVGLMGGRPRFGERYGGYL